MIMMVRREMMYVVVLWAGLDDAIYQSSIHDIAAKCTMWNIESGWGLYILHRFWARDILVTWLSRDCHISVIIGVCVWWRREQCQLHYLLCLTKKIITLIMSQTNI